jgi:hypothetical protein
MISDLEQKYSTPVEQFPEPMSREAFHGITGEIINAITPHSEACKEAVLIQLLVGFGNIIGRNAHTWIGNDKHHCNEFCAVVGDTGLARKGTSWGLVGSLLTLLDEAWALRRVRHGFPSGESIIYHVRDPRFSNDGERTVADEGVTDKRLLINEAEFARLLRASANSGNTLSPTLRVSWDAPKLLTNSGKTAGDEATEAHISAILHITRCDLEVNLNRQDIGNGLGNRILWGASRRVQKISRPRRIDWNAESDIVPCLKQCVATATEKPREFGFSRSAEKAWDAFYQGIPEIPGPVGQMTTRMDAHAIRLAMIYAALDRVSQVDECHIKAAVSVVEYCNRTVKWLFSTTMGDKDTNLLLRALKNEPEGMGRTEIYRDVFNNNRSAESISGMLTDLRTNGLVGVLGRKGSRDSEVWFAVEHEATAKPVSTLTKLGASNTSNT